MHEHPPKPRFALSVGIIGHRPNRLPAEAVAKITTQMNLALDAIGKAGSAAHQQYADFFSTESAKLIAVTSLAEGADRIGAKQALTLGFDLSVSLPFCVQDYRDDFQGPVSEQEFDQLLEAATTVLEIAGDRGNEGAAYEHAGQSVMDACDLLIAVWDGKASAGRGGTTDLLYEAAEEGMPVIWIDTVSDGPIRLHWREPGGRRTEQTYFDQEFRAKPGDDALATIGVVVEQLVRPPRSPSEQMALQDFLQRPFRPLNVHAAFPLLQALLRVRPLRWSDFFRIHPDKGAADMSRQEIAPRSLVEAYTWADECAIFFSQAFRGAFVLNFLGSALVTILVAFSFRPPWSVLEIVVVALLVYNTSRGRKGRWHKLWIETREVAERLRACMLLYALGSRPVLPFGDVPAWTSWYVRAQVRQAGLRNALLDRGGLTAACQALLSFLEGQKAYHQATAARFSALHERLSTIGKWLFFFSLAISLTVLVVQVFRAEAISPSAQRWLFVLNAGLPALGVASYGMRVIGDFEGAAARSTRMVMQLESLIGKLKATPCQFDALRDLCRRAADVLQGDVASWRLVVESRELEMPG